MTEKKTFKNPWQISHGSDWICIYPVEDSNKHEDFHEADWDIEVTFTKKAPVFQKGDRVAFTEYGYRDEYTVEHQRDSYVWVFDDGDDYEVMNAEDLTKI